MSPSHDRRVLDRRSEPERRRHAAPACRASPRAPAQLGRTRQRAAAPGEGRGRLRHPGHLTATGGAIISTRDAVTFGFGLEQVSEARRAASYLKRSLSYLLPTTADTTAPTIVGFKVARRRASRRPRQTRSRPSVHWPTTSAATWTRDQPLRQRRSSAPRPRSSRSSSATRRPPRPVGPTVTPSTAERDRQGRRRQYHAGPPTSASPPRRSPERPSRCR